MNFLRQSNNTRTSCGDGIVQSPNSAGTGGPGNDGYEQCDTNAGVSTGYTCNSSCVLVQNTPGGNTPGGAVVIFSSTGSSVQIPASTTPEKTPEPEVLGDKLAPVLKITKTASKTMVGAGNTLDYTITVTNTGNHTSINTVLTDILPVGLHYADMEQMSRDWTLGDIPAGSSNSITYSAKVDTDVKPGTLINKAVVSADNHSAVSATAEVKVSIQMVLGEKILPASGFRISEFFAIIALLFATIAVSLVLRGKENKG